MQKTDTTEKILIVGPSWVGDTVMSQSLLRLLKQQNANHEIHVLAPEWTFSVLERMPEVDKAIEMPFKHGELKVLERFRFARQLKAEGYDRAIVLPNSFKSALIPWFAGIPKRTGWRGEQRYGLINDLRVLQKSIYPLMVEQYLALGLPKGQALSKPYPHPLLKTTQEARQLVLDKFSLGCNERPVLALAAGAAFGTAKRWPAEYYAAVAKQQIDKGWDVWLFGSKDDLPVTEEINQLVGGQCQNLAGKLRLAETIDLLSVSTGLISNDSGLMHIAAALEKPLIAIYGPTSPSFTPPLSPRANVLQLDLSCQPCFARDCPLQHHQCMLDIKPEKVISLVAGWGPD